jgi:hypothetical protein
MMAVTKSPFLRQILMKHALTSLLFSLSMSWFIGILFEATGLTVLIGGLLSSVISYFIYRLMDIFPGLFNGDLLNNIKRPFESLKVVGV